MAGRIAGTSSQTQSASSEEQRGGFFGAIGDFLGFDGEFGYDGINGPSGAGRQLSLAGLGGAIGDFVGLDGQFGQQGLYPPVQVALEGDEIAYRRQLALRNLGRAFGRVAGATARVIGGIVAAPVVELALADPAGGRETILEFEGMADLRLRNLSSETGWTLQRAETEIGIFGPFVRWRGVGSGTMWRPGEDSDIGFVVLNDPEGISERIGRELPSRIIAVGPHDADPRTWQAPPSLDSRVMTGERDGARFVLLHYTDPAGQAGILSDMHINATPDGYFGTGVYLTDILPGTRSSNDLAFIFKNRPERPIGEYSQFVAVDVTGLNVARPAFWHPVRSSIYINRGSQGINLNNRLVAYGPNANPLTGN